MRYLKWRFGYIGSMEDFRNWVQSMQLFDLPLVNRKFTWMHVNLHSRLDRGLVNLEWCIKFPDMKLWALNWAIFYHCSLMLETSKEDWGPKSFCTLDTWLSHLGFIK